MKIFSSLRPSHLFDVAVVMGIFYLSVTGIVHVNYDRHYDFAKNIFDGYSVVTTYPVMHILLHFLDKIFSTSLDWKPIFSIVMFGAYLSRYFIVRFYLKNIKGVRMASLLAIASILFFSPLYNLGQHPASFIQPNYVTSPTTIFTFPFCYLLFIYTTQRLTNFDFSIILKVSLFSVLVFMTKPSYLLSFIPAFFTWVVVASYRKKHIKLSTLILGSVPALGMLALGAYLVTSGYKIGIDPFKIWLMYSGGSWIKLAAQLFISCLLPLYVLFKILDGTYRGTTSFYFASFVVLISFSISVLFYDVPTPPAGNFLQQMHVSFNILILESVIILFSAAKRDYIGLVLTALYVIYGLVYLKAYLNHSLFVNLFS